jgi:hypothetical protein
MEGINVRLSDGEMWALSLGDPIRNDPEFDALIAAAMDVEDIHDALLAELALTIFLLRRNYDLDSDQLTSLLTFAPGDPALSVLQRMVHDLVVAMSARKQDLEASPAKESQVRNQSDIIPGPI